MQVFHQVLVLSKARVSKFKPKFRSELRTQFGPKSTSQKQPNLPKTTRKQPLKQFIQQFEPTVKPTIDKLTVEPATHLQQLAQQLAATR